MILIWVLVSIIFYKIIKSLHRYFSQTLNYWKKRNVKGPTPFPVLGNFIDLFFLPLNVIEEQRLQKYGTVYGTFEFSTPVLTIADPELIREVAIKQFHNFTNRYNRHHGDEFFKKSLFTMTDDTWKTVRSIISPVFTNSKMRKMFRHIDNCAENTLQYIEKISVTGEEIILKDVMTSFTLDTIAKCIFGVETNGHKNPNDEFIKKAIDFANMKLWRIVSALMVPSKLQKPLNLQIIDKHLVDFFSSLMKNIIKERKVKDVNFDDFIDILLKREETENSADFTDISGGHFVNQSQEDLELQKKAMKSNLGKRKLEENEIIANCILFFMAGYETTSTLLNFTLYCLAIKPEIQENLYSEIQEYLRHENNIDYNGLQELKYLDAVVSESLRLYSPAVNLDRYTSNDTVLGKTGIHIEKGTIINLPFYAIHHNPQFFPEPHQFRPERFFPENRHLIKPYTYLPFGVGPRNCIGMRFALMSAKLFIVKLLNRFQISKTEKTPLYPKFVSSFITLASEPLFVKFAPREQK